METLDIKTLREKAGMTQQELAGKTGIPQGRIAKWEVRGSVPKADDYNKVLAVTSPSKNVPEVIRNPLLKPVRNRGGGKPVKYYDTDFAAGSHIIFYEDNIESPAYEMNIPAFAGCIAFNVFGDSMESLIKSGSIVFGRKLEDWRSYIEYGQIYGIVMKDERRFLKYVRKSKKNSIQCFLLRSENEHYDDFEIPKDKIHTLWLIEGWMLKRT